MHLLTGFALAALLGKKDRGGHSPLLGNHGPIRMEHLVPGRVRFRVSALVGNADGRSRVSEKLPRIDGVDSVEVSPVTGSVLIRYQPEQVQPELLCAALIRLLGLESELARPPQPLIAKELREVFEALNYAVYRQTGGLLDLWTALPILLALLGGRKLLREGLSSVPPGLTLLWWAYVTLFPGRPR